MSKCFKCGFIFSQEDEYFGECFPIDDNKYLCSDCYSDYMVKKQIKINSKTEKVRVNISIPLEVKKYFEKESELTGVSQSSLMSLALSRFSMISMFNKENKLENK